MTLSKTRLGGVIPHHLGVAVNEIMDGIRGYRNFGWNWDGEIIEDADRSVKLVFLQELDRRICLSLLVR